MATTKDSGEFMHPFIVLDSNLFKIFLYYTSCYRSVQEPGLFTLWFVQQTEIGMSCSLVFRRNTQPVFLNVLQEDIANQRFA